MEIYHANIMYDWYPARNLTRPFIFCLPLEVRQMIYSLVQQQERWRSRDDDEVGPLTGSYLFRYGSPKSKYYPWDRLTLWGLRGANRQLYRETASYVIYPKLFMRMVDNLAFEKWSAPALQKFMTIHTFALENIVTIQIKICANGKYLNLSHNSLNRSCDLAVTSSLTTIREALSNLFKRPDAVETKPFSLKLFLPLLEACPQLNFVVIYTDEPNLYDRWEDPIGDVDAFLPLLQRKVQVQIVQQPSRVQKVETNARFLELLKLMPEYEPGKRVVLRQIGSRHWASFKVYCPAKVVAPKN